MKAAKFATLRLTALSFLLTGLAGLIFSAMISTDYLDTKPKMPVPQELRMTPRNIHGTVIYQTQQEDRNLSLIEYSSVAVFLVGLCLGVVYLEKWGGLRARETGDDDSLSGYLS
jgi:hypothetical protein